MASRKVVGGWELQRRLGAGSFASVFLAHRVDPAPDGVAVVGPGLNSGIDDVAVKAVSRAKLNKKLEENLAKEVSILTEMSHAHIVTLWGTVEASRHIYLIMEFCAGGDLHGLLRKHGSFSADVARHFMQQLVEGVQFMCAQNLIHRDLKPQNLLLSERSTRATLKIADFGFATYVDAAAMADTMCGSPLYMAPEILDGKRYDYKADLWSAGTILFEMLAGKPPFSGGSPRDLLRNILRGKFSAAPLLHTVPPACDALLQGLLQVNPEQRLDIDGFYRHAFLRAAAEPPSDELQPSLNEDEDTESRASELPDSAAEESNDGDDDDHKPTATAPLSTPPPRQRTPGQEETWEMIVSPPPSLPQTPALNSNSINKPSGITRTLRAASPIRPSPQPRRSKPAAHAAPHAASALPQTSRAVHALRLAGELCKRVRLLAQLADGVAAGTASCIARAPAGDGSVLLQTAPGTRAAALLDMSEHHAPPRLVAVVLLVKCVKVLRGALQNMDADVAELGDGALLQAARTTREELRRVHNACAERALALRRALSEQELSLSEVPSAERLLLEIALQLGRASAQAQLAGHDEGLGESTAVADEAAARALSVAHALVELLCAETGLGRAERERVQGLNAVFTQRRSLLPRIKT